MICSYKELKEIYGSGYQINKAINSAKIYKLESGLYSDKKSNHYLEIFTKKYPKAIITHDSAYFYHNLTDVIPSKIFMTTDRNSGRFNDKNIVQFFSIDTLYNLGKTSIKYEGIDINIYDKERMLLELVKNKNHMAYDYYKEIIENYRDIKDELDVYKLQKYADVYSNGEKLMTMIQDEVF